MSTSPQTERDKQIVEFLERIGWGDAFRAPLGEDASTRRYERLRRGDDKAILMDAPPAAESKPCGPDASEKDRVLAGWNGRTRLAACRVDAFVGIDEHLKSLGLSAPDIYAYDVETGLCLLEDLGDAIFARELEKGASEEELYTAAIDALAHVHNTATPTIVSAGEFIWPILEYDRLALTTGADLFPKWYPKYAEGVNFSGKLARAFDDTIAEMSEHLASLPKILMLRDYHAENLLWLPERDGLAKVGILDFQDAVQGPAAWDLVMFLQDARRDVSPEIVDLIYKRYLDLTGHDDESFSRDYAMSGAINALRIIGVFARLIWRDGKPRYEAFLPREWGHLRTSLAHPALADLTAILEEAAPQLKEAM